MDAILEYVEFFFVENEVHVHEWMQLLISCFLSNILYYWLIKVCVLKQFVVWRSSCDYS